MSEENTSIKSMASAQNTGCWTTRNQKKQSDIVKKEFVETLEKRCLVIRVTQVKIVA